jgi:hypothetical protein
MSPLQVLLKMSALQISIFDQAIPSASLGAVLTADSFSPASAQTAPDFSAITVESLAPPFAVRPLQTAMQFPASNNKVDAATPRKRRGKSMTRRRGQDGSIETSGRWRVVRFWIDVPGQNKRQHACVRICPASGPGLLSAATQRRHAREIIAKSGADAEEHFTKVVVGKKVVTFKKQAE